MLLNDQINQRFQNMDTLNGYSIGSITVREQRPMELISCIVSILGTVVIETSSI